MKRYFALLALLALGACSSLSTVNNAASTPAPQQLITDARTTVLGIDNLYGIAVITADTWAQPTNRCGAPGAGPPPVCSTAAGIVAVNKAAVAMRNGLNKAEALVLKANPNQSELTLAIDTAKTAWSAYQATLATYGIKTS